MMTTGGQTMSEHTRDEIADAVKKKVLNMRVEYLLEYVRGMVFQDLMVFYRNNATQEDVKNLMEDDYSGTES